MLLLGALIYTSSILAECGPAVSPETIRAIIQVESAGNPLAIGDNNLKKGFSPRNEEEAVQLASRLIDQGHSVDLGLMQINSRHIAPMKLTLKELFDPCRNIRIGTSILSDFYLQLQTDDPVQSLFRALSAYNTGQAWKGGGYINRILEAAGAAYRVLPATYRLQPLNQAKPAGEEMSRPPPNMRELASASPLFFRNFTSTLQTRKP